MPGARCAGRGQGAHRASGASEVSLVPEGLPGDSRYNVAQLYARLAESIRDGKPASPSFAAAVTRHRLLDGIMRASETGRKQVL